MNRIARSGDRREAALNACLSPGGEGEGEVIVRTLKGHRWLPVFDTKKDTLTVSGEGEGEGEGEDPCLNFALPEGEQTRLAFMVGHSGARTWSFDNIMVNSYVLGSGYNLDAPYEGEGEGELYRHWDGVEGEGECN